MEKRDLHLGIKSVYLYRLVKTVGATGRICHLNRKIWLNLAVVTEKFGKIWRFWEICLFLRSRIIDD